jgi:hypothetical protein
MAGALISINHVRETWVSFRRLNVQGTRQFATEAVFIMLRRVSGFSGLS